MSYHLGMMLELDPAVMANLPTMKGPGKQAAVEPSSRLPTQAWSVAIAAASEPLRQMQMLMQMFPPLNKAPQKAVEAVQNFLSGNLGQGPVALQLLGEVRSATSGSNPKNPEQTGLMPSVNALTSIINSLMTGLTNGTIQPPPAPSAITWPAADFTVPDAAGNANLNVGPGNTGFVFQQPSALPAWALPVGLGLGGLLLLKLLRK